MNGMDKNAEALFAHYVIISHKNEETSDDIV